MEANTSDRQIKAEATRKEKARVFEGMSAPRDIVAECSTGVWVRRVWRSGNSFGWHKWQRA